MKKYLREIELSSAILCIIGVVIALRWGYGIGAWPCGVGLLLFLLIFLYKAFHWKEYERDNKQYIVIVLLAIFLIIVQMIFRR